MLVPDKISIWTVYDHPTDYPTQFVARLFSDFKATSTVVTGPTLEAVRNAIQQISPYVLTAIPRQPFDDPCIVECWI